ncbi:MAG: helix-turn-helix domain-containing protein [Proteobacteria bacterium]|nr:helix-turn-helix domain-containing protein [Pseudomonadota bacterium]
MPFSERLSKLRNERGLTQQEMAKLIGVGIAQMRRYEKGKSSPTLDVIKNIARTLGVSADELIFDKDERVAAAKILDRRLLEQFELISRLSPHDKEAVKIILESMIIKSRLEEVMPSPRDDTWTKEMRQVVSELRKGAEGYSEEEINDIVDEAVKAVRAEGEARSEHIEA